MGKRITRLKFCTYPNFPHQISITIFNSWITAMNIILCKLFYKIMSQRTGFPGSSTSPRCKIIVCCVPKWILNRWENNRWPAFLVEWQFYWHFEINFSFLFCLTAKSHTTLSNFTPSTKAEWNFFLPGHQSGSHNPHPQGNQKLYSIAMRWWLLKAKVWTGSEEKQISKDKEKCYPLTSPE